MATDSFNGDASAQARQQLYEDRWSSYGSNTGILNLSDTLTPNQLKQYDIFKAYDDNLLLDLIPDISIAKWKSGAVLFEEGSYLDLAFFIVDGEVDVFLAKHQDSAVQPIFDASRVAPGGDGAPPGTPDLEQTLHISQVQRVEQQQGGKKTEDSGVTFLSSMDFDLPAGERVRLGKGDIFGEIGALNGWPQSVTARAATDVTVIQIRLPALRQMKKRSSDFNDWVDKIYRERTLFTQLKSTPLFRGSDERFVNALTQRVELISLSPGDQLMQQGEPEDALYMVRSGFLKVSQEFGGEPMAVTYLSKGMTVGEVELLIDEIQGWQFSTSSVGYSELVKIPKEDFLEIIRAYPVIERRLWEASVAKIRESGHTKKPRQIGSDRVCPRKRPGARK